MWDIVKRMKALGYLSRIARNRHILCLNEVHGLPSEVLAELRSILPNWKFWYSPCFDAEGSLDPAKGGVLFLVCPDLCKVATHIEHTVFVPGRAHRLE